MKNDRINKTLEMAVRFKEIILSVAGIVVILLNLWLTTKLYPLAQDIDQLRFNIEAVETRVDLCEIGSDRVYNELKEINARINVINDKITDIYRFYYGHESQ